MAQETQYPELKEQTKPFPWPRLLGTVLTIALLVYLLVEHGWQELVQSLKNISWQYFILTLALMLVSRLAVTARWHFLLRSAGVPIPVRESLRLTFAGLFSTNFLPTTIGGDLVRFLGAVQIKIDPAICAASLIMDRLVGMAGMILVLPIGIAQLLHGPLKTTGWLSQGIYSLAIAGINIEKIQKKIKEALAPLTQAIRLWISKPQGVLLSLGATAVHMLVIFLVIWLIFQGMNEHINFWMVAGIYSMSYLITLLPISINGLGVQEVSLAYLYNTYGGVSMPSALAMAILVRTLFMAASLPGAIFIPSFLAMRRNRIKN